MFTISPATEKLRAAAAFEEYKFLSALQKEYVPYFRKVTAHKIVRHLHHEDSEFRSKLRKFALRLHPDKNTNSNAAQAFALIKLYSENRLYAIINHYYRYIDQEDLADIIVREYSQVQPQPQSPDATPAATTAAPPAATHIDEEIVYCPETNYAALCDYIKGYVWYSCWKDNKLYDEWFTNMEDIDDSK